MLFKRQSPIEESSWIFWIALIGQCYIVNFDFKFMIPLWVIKGKTADLDLIRFGEIFIQFVEVANQDVLTRLKLFVLDG